MIGTTVKITKKISVWYWLILLLSLPIIGGGIADKLFILFGIGLILLSIALAGIVLAKSHILAEFHETGINLYPNKISLDYLSLKAISAVAFSKKKSNQQFYELDIATHNFGFRFPANIDVPSAMIEEFLIGKLTPFIDLPSDPDIAEFYSEQTAKYATERIHLFHGRVRPRRNIPAIRILKHVAFPIITCLLLIVLGNLMPFPLGRNKEEIVYMMLIGFVTIGFVTVIFLARRDAEYSINKLVPQKTSLVISLDGFAICQVDMKGKLMWNQVRKIQNKSAAKFMVSNEEKLYGLKIKIDGTQINIIDAYDRSLDYIEQIMRSYAFD